MTLYFEEQGDGDPVFLVHGLFGSGTNLRRVARGLADDFRVINVDLPNHGRSPHTGSMSYPDIRDALLETMQRLGIRQASWVGHSMGGKAVMDLALGCPDVVTQLVVLDIAPVEYADEHKFLIDAMLDLDVEALNSRADAERALSGPIPDASTRLFLMQNLTLRDGRYQWRLNLPVLRDDLGNIMGFPRHDGSYTGPVLYLSGADSNYVQPSDHEIIVRYFPQAVFEVVADAGHWIHADQPGAVSDLISGFLNETKTQNKLI